MPTLKFTKMHGLGNDFIVIDAINQKYTPNPEQIRSWSNRHFGIGFDQLLLVEKPDDPKHDFKYRIFNANGNEVEQCGNGARCFARFVVEKGLSDKTEFLIETAKGIISPKLEAGKLVRVNMGKPLFSPEQIPFIAKEAALQYTLNIDNQTVKFVTVNMGNPHAVLVVDDVKTAPVLSLGPALEVHPSFPEQVNVGFMQVIQRNEIKLRVFERGVGETLACGTGACAAVVAGIRLGLLDATVTVHTSGGDLMINWQMGESVLMTGPAETIYEGELSI